MHKKIDPTVSTIAVAGLIAIAAGLGVSGYSATGDGHVVQLAPPAFADTASPPAAPQWAASATGRVEPKDGEIRIATQVPGKIAEVLAKTNDKVEAGDLLLRLDDQDIYVRIAASVAEVGVRERELTEEPATGLALERQKAEDAVAKAQRAVFAAHEAADAVARAFRAGSASAEALAAERAKVVDAVAKLDAERANLNTVNGKSGMPLTTRLESSLATARAELTGAEIALERTRVRAPSSGTVLNMIAKPGETAVPSPESAVLVFGDLSGLRVRAEVEERDAAKVRVGQKVVVKADAFPDKEFEGQVTSISQSLGAPRIATRGPRRPNDVEVVEVMVGLDGNPPLFTGMRVDTFFKLETTASSARPGKTN